MDSIVVDKIKPDQVVTITFGEKDVTLTKLEEPRKFTLADWYPEEQDIYILDPVMAEDELLHYSLTPMGDLEEALAKNKGRFGINQLVFTFMNRPIESLEMEGAEDEEDEEEEEEDAGDE